MSAAFAALYTGACGMPNSPSTEALWMIDADADRRSEPEERVRQLDRRAQVDVDHRVPMRVAVGGDRLERDGARVVHEHVDDPVTSGQLRPPRA